MGFTLLTFTWARSESLSDSARLSPRQPLCILVWSQQRWLILGFFRGKPARAGLTELASLFLAKKASRRVARATTGYGAVW